MGGLASHSWAAFKRDCVTLLIGMVVLGVTLMVMGAAQAGLQIAVIGFAATDAVRAFGGDGYSVSRFARLRSSFASCSRPKRSSTSA